MRRRSALGRPQLRPARPAGSLRPAAASTYQLNGEPPQQLPASIQRCCQLRQGLRMHERGHGSLKPLVCIAHISRCILGAIESCRPLKSCRKMASTPMGAPQRLLQTCAVELRTQAGGRTRTDCGIADAGGCSIMSTTVGRTCCPRDGYTVCAGAVS